MSGNEGYIMKVIREENKCEKAAIVKEAAKNCCRRSSSALKKRKSIKRDRFARQNVLSI